MISVVDPQKKLTTTLLLRPKLRLKRGWPRPKQWLGTNVPYNNNGLDPCRVAAKEQKISTNVMGINGATISHPTVPELTGSVKVAS